MAVLTITDVEVIGSVTPEELNVGEAVNAFAPLYLKSADLKYYMAEAGEGSEESTMTYLSLTASSAAGKVIAIPLTGTSAVELKLTGPTLSVGADGIVVLSATKGKFCLVTDLTSNDYTSILGVPKTTSNILVKVHNTDVQEP